MTDRVLFWTEKEENIYSRSWESGTVIISLSSSLSKAHRAHCPKKDISYIVFHFQKAVKHPDRIKVQCQDETFDVKIIIYYAEASSIYNVPAVKSFHQDLLHKGKNISDPLVSTLSQRSCLLNPSVALKLTPVRQEQRGSFPLTRHSYKASPTDVWSCLLKPEGSMTLMVIHTIRG